MAVASPRFYNLSDVAEILHISVKQVYALVRRGDLPAIKIGGRGQWRVEHSELENYIGTAYRTTRQYIKDHPFTGDEQTDEMYSGPSAKTGADSSADGGSAPTTGEPALDA
jgi:excisionase family DNA binding protein